jgi:hypothetical protein
VSTPHGQRSDRQSDQTAQLRTATHWASMLGADQRAVGAQPIAHPVVRSRRSEFEVALHAAPRHAAHCRIWLSQSKGTLRASPHRVSSLHCEPRTGRPSLNHPCCMPKGRRPPYVITRGRFRRHGTGLSRGGAIEVRGSDAALTYRVQSIDVLLRGNFRPDLGWAAGPYHLRLFGRQSVAVQRSDHRDARLMVILALARSDYSHSHDRWRY